MPTPTPTSLVSRIACALFAVSVLCTSTPSAADAQRVEVTLSPADRDAVGKLACARYEVDAEEVGPVFRWSGTGMAKVIYAPVRCAPHAYTQNLPVRYRVNCQRRGGRWHCTDGRETLSVTTRLGVVDIEPGSFSRTQAITAARAAAASNRFRAELDTALPSGCGLYVDVSAHTDDLADLSCNSGHSFLISFWCPQSDCPRLLSVR